MQQIDTIEEGEELEEKESSDISRVVSNDFELIDSTKLFTQNLNGLILVADDQHINLEIIKQHMSKIKLQNQCRYFING